jgi:sugar lactone lactonase YvrE
MKSKMHKLKKAMAKAIFKKTKLAVVLCFAGCIANAQIVYTLAGNGTAGYTGDGSFAVNGEISTSALPNLSVVVTGLYRDGLGNLYITDGQNNRIRKVNANGTISTIIGNGTAGYTGDGAAASSAKINTPSGIVIDASGNIYISDMNNQVIRKINTAGTISTFAGNGTAGFSGDAVAATAAKLNYPLGLAIDGSGNLYISDCTNNRIRMVNTSGTISTVVGGGSSLGDGGAATSAQLFNPAALTFDASGNMYIADLDHERVRKVNTAGIISTFAGNGTAGFSGDGGAATSAMIASPTGLSFDASGNLYIADATNMRVRKVNTSGTISTFAGTGTTGFSGDGGVPTSANMNSPLGVCTDASGNLYIADGGTKIREVSAKCPANAGPNVSDVQTCTSWSVQVGTPAVTNMNYSWSPATATHYTLASTSAAQPTVTFNATVTPAPIFTVTVSYSLCTTSTSTVQVTPVKLACPGCCRLAATGIATANQTASTFVVYPNPASGQVTLSLYDKAAYIRVVDMQGRLVFEIKDIDAQEFILDITKYNKGIYFISTKMGDVIEKQKLVVE